MTTSIRPLLRPSGDILPRTCGTRWRTAGSGPPRAFHTRLRRRHKSRRTAGRSRRRTSTRGSSARRRSSKRSHSRGRFGCSPSSSGHRPPAGRRRHSSRTLARTRHRRRYRLGTSLDSSEISVGKGGVGGPTPPVVGGPPSGPRTPAVGRQAGKVAARRPLDRPGIGRMRPRETPSVNGARSMPTRYGCLARSPGEC